MLDQYKTRIIHFYKTQIKLLNKLASMLTFKSANLAGYEINPTQHSIEAQIKAWPDETFLLPLASWIEPRKGVLEVDGSIWEFVLHGIQDISFIERETKQDVTIT